MARLCASRLRGLSCPPVPSAFRLDVKREASGIFCGFRRRANRSGSGPAGGTEKLILVSATAVRDGPYVGFQMTEAAISDQSVRRHPAADQGTEAAALRVEHASYSMIASGSRSMAEVRPDDCDFNNSERSARL